ncbi:unnamed protein product [Rotaria sordida]|uniref:Uncharacterized protein n=1 Tax=Rotaria sordida TaxID=392033 RepID=A0A820C4T4_9BILA|nr:unnamed protein product [Rotaria sordida]
MSKLSNDTYYIEYISNKNGGGIEELITLIKQSDIPIICICNDRQHQKIRSLANCCYDLRFTRPRVEQIRSAMLRILDREKIFNFKQDILDEIIQLCNQGIRQIIDLLNLWTN